MAVFWMALWRAGARDHPHDAAPGPAKRRECLVLLRTPDICGNSHASTGDWATTAAVMEPIPRGDARETSQMSSAFENTRHLRQLVRSSSSTQGFEALRPHSRRRAVTAEQVAVRRHGGPAIGPQ